MKKLLNLFVIGLITSMLFACSNKEEHVNMEQQENITTETTVNTEPEIEIDYLYPKKEFSKLDIPLYTDPKGSAKIIGHTFENEYSLLAIKYQGELAEEAQFLRNEQNFVIKAIYSDGTSAESEIGSVESIEYRYIDNDNSSIIIYNIGSAVNGTTLARLDYQLLINSESEIQQAVLEPSNETIELLGIERLAPYSKSNAGITLEDENKSVQIDSYSYIDGIINILGKVTFKKDISNYQELAVVYMPNRNSIYSSEYEGREYFSGIAKDFNLSFKVGNLAKENDVAEAYIFGLGTILKLQENAILPKSKNLYDHRTLIPTTHLVNGNLIYSNIWGLPYQGNNNLHNTLKIQMNDMHSFIVFRNKNQLASGAYIQLGKLFDKLSFDLKKNIVVDYKDEGLNPYNQPITDVFTVEFYAMKEPDSINVKNDVFIEDMDEARKSELLNDMKLIKSVTFSKEQTEIQDVELDVSEANYLGIYINGPSFNYSGSGNSFSHDLLLTDGELFYKNFPQN